jgi:predicted DNA-binding protein with PD1-like motif
MLAMPVEPMARIYTLSEGTSLVEGILDIARKEQIKTARVEAIGTVNKLTLGFYNRRVKKYEEHKFEEQLEVTGLLGNITLKDGKPFLHAHATFGRRDASVVGGHVLSATVSPLLEVVITATENTARRRFDEALGLNTIYKIEG